MELNRFKEKVEELAKINNIFFTKAQITQLYRYMNLLIEWNEKINLTAITEPNDVILKHFIDSASVNKYLSNAKELIDVGTGAGFPGLVLKTLNPNMNVTLLDALNKRINFLNEVINENELINVNTIHGRAEELGKNLQYREKFDVVVSRAVANMNVLLEYMMPLVKVDGICICMKSMNIDEELENSMNTIALLGGVLEKVDKIFLKDEEGNAIERDIVIIKKMQNTENIYPRTSNKINKKPLV